jgi:ABC-type uncharacterized transport system permease subunit
MTPDLSIAALSIAAALVYLAAAWRQLMRLEQNPSRFNSGIAWLGLIAVLGHMAVAVLSARAGELNLGFYRIASLIFLAMGIVSLLLLIRRPLHTLTIIVFPLAALSVLISTFAPATGRPLSGLEVGLLWHVSASLTAFAVLALATLQGFSVLAQAKLLRAHQTRGIIRWLPPLDLTEQMFFELVGAGFTLLTLAIVAGAVFIDNLFAQHLVHKTVLTGIGWVIYGVLLVGHWRSGWRMATAVKLAVTAFVIVTLGFFGSKLMLELVLDTP